MRDFVPVRRLTSGERVAFCSHLGWPLRPPIPRPLFYGRGGRRAEPPVGEGSGPRHKTEAAHFFLDFFVSSSPAPIEFFQPPVNDLTLRGVLHCESQIFNSIARAIDVQAGGESVCFNH